MFNEFIEAEVTSTSPFRFQDGEDIRHGVAVKCVIETEKPDVLKDIVVDYASTKSIFNSKNVVAGNVNLLTLKKSGITFAIEGMRPKRCDITKVSISPGRSIEILVKIPDITEGVMGAICSKLGYTISVNFALIQGELPLKTGREE